MASGLYYGSAEEAASQLGLPLLLAAASSAAVPRLGVRLSDHAPDTVLGSRLYHRLNLGETSEPTVLWIVSPRETVEHLGWAVGVAEHAARTGKTAYLLDLDRSSSMRRLVAGEGHPVPPTVLTRIERLRIRAAATWASDLQGVRITLPTTRLPKGEAIEIPSSWILILACSIPELAQEISNIAKEVDGVLFTAGIRDHSRAELESTVAALREAEASMLGFVAMGPVPRQKSSPLDRWTDAEHVEPEILREEPKAPEKPVTREKIEEPAPHVEPEEPVAAEEEPSYADEIAVDETPEPVGEPEFEIPETSDEQEEPVADVEPEEVPAEPAKEPAPSSVDLIAGWQSKSGDGSGHKGSWLILLAAAIVSVIGLMLVYPEYSPMTLWGDKAETAADSTKLAQEEEAETPSATIDDPGPSTVDEQPDESASVSIPDATDSAAVEDTVDDAGEPFLTVLPPGDEGEETETIPTAQESLVTAPEDSISAAEGIDEAEDQDFVTAPRETDIVETILNEAAESDQIMPPPVSKTDDVDTAQIDSGEPDTADESISDETTVAGQEGTGTLDGPVAEETLTPNQEEIVATGETFGIPEADDVTTEPVEAWPDTFVVHVSSFRGKVDAERDAVRLREAGLDAFVVSVIIPDQGQWERVVVGVFPDRDSASREAARIKEMELVSWTQVLRHGGVNTPNR